MDRPTGSSHAAFGLALVCAAGGIAGYVTRKSLPSLLAGLGLGAAFGASGYLINSGHPDVGHPLALAGSATLAGAMGSRAAKTKKLWPAGVLASLGVLSSLYQGKKTYEWLA